MRTLFITLFIVLGTFICSAKKQISEKEKLQIQLILDKQEQAWNEGNLEDFMDTYWKSEKLVFVGGRGPTYGWQATLDNYRKGYPNKAAMGKLNFKILNVEKIDTKTIFVVGRYELIREIGDAAGHFSIIVQKKNGHWVITSDHSSSE